MASFFYTQGMKEMLDGTIDIDTNTLKIMLVKSGYVPAKADLVVDAGGANDAVDHELTVSGYTPGWGGAGRKTPAVTMGTSTARVDIAIADLTWTALAAGETIANVLLIKEGGANDTTSRLIACFDVTDTATNGGDITLDFATLGAGGNMQISV